MIPSKLPTSLIRIDDGAEFILNEDSQKYYLKSANNDKKKGHLVFEYPYENLMMFRQNKGKFKIRENTDDLETMRKDWFNSFTKNSGHE
jgi:hypothetical protein